MKEEDLLEWMKKQQEINDSHNNILDLLVKDMRNIQEGLNNIKGEIDLMLKR